MVFSIVSHAAGNKQIIAFCKVRNNFFSFGIEKFIKSSFRICKILFLVFIKQAVGFGCFGNLEGVYIFSGKIAYKNRSAFKGIFFLFNNFRFGGSGNFRCIGCFLLICGFGIRSCRFLNDFRFALRFFDGFFLHFAGAKHKQGKNQRKNFFHNAASFFLYTILVTQGRKSAADYFISPLDKRRRLRYLRFAYSFMRFI